MREGWATSSPKMAEPAHLAFIEKNRAQSGPDANAGNFSAAGGNSRMALHCYAVAHLAAGHLHVYHVVR